MRDTDGLWGPHRLSFGEEWRLAARAGEPLPKDLQAVWLAELAWDHDNPSVVRMLDSLVGRTCRTRHDLPCLDKESKVFAGTRLIVRARFGERLLCEAPSRRRLLMRTEWLTFYRTKNDHPPVAALPAEPLDLAQLDVSEDELDRFL
jgi:hypothetical protein